MGQRTQLHIKKDNKFYVIHDQWGYDIKMIKNIDLLIENGLLDTDKKIEDVFKNVQEIVDSIQKKGSADWFLIEENYYSVDKGDNNNGVFLIDLDNKKYCLLAGNEDIHYIKYNTPFEYHECLSVFDYLMIQEDDEDCVPVGGFLSKKIDNILLDSGFKLMVNYGFQGKDADLLTTFLKESENYEEKEQEMKKKAQQNFVDHHINELKDTITLEKNFSKKYDIEINHKGAIEDRIEKIKNSDIPNCLKLYCIDEINKCFSTKK